MIAIGVFLMWASYGLGLWGVSLIKGWNLGFKEIWSPTAYYDGKWPPQLAGNTAIIPDGTKASTVSADFEASTPDTSTSGASGTPGNTGSIASIASGYKGHCYKYGGAPGRNGKDCWDCSSFCNWAIGHDAGLSIPGYKPGKYDGSVHGPATTSWLAFGSRVMGISSAQPGDVIVWQTHMGIYLGGGKMISALNERLGTQVTTVQAAAPAGQVMVIRRLAA